MKRPVQLIAMAVVSCNNLAPQIAALLMLSPREFGTFSLGYLAFSLAASVALSTVSEAYARAKPHEINASVPTYFGAISTWLSVAFGLVAGILFLVMTGSYLTTILSMVAVSGAARRTTIRYHELQTSSWRELLSSETVAIVVFVAVLSVSFTGLDPLISILLAWAASVMALWFFGTTRRPGTPKEAASWVSQYKQEIRPLLGESLIQNMSAIGTPYVLAPILGTFSFGIYRAVSNFNAPVRLGFNFFRPYLATRSLATTLSWRYLLLLNTLSLTWGMAFAVILLWVAERPSGIAMLDALAAFWLPTAIYMTSTVLVLYFYIVARTKVKSKILLRARWIQTFASIVFPIVGAITGELTGAIWGYAIATIVGATVWFAVVQLQVRHGRT